MRQARPAGAPRADWKWIQPRHEHSLNGYQSLWTDLERLSCVISFTSKVTKNDNIRSPRTVATSAPQLNSFLTPCINLLIDSTFSGKLADVSAKKECTDLPVK